MFINKRKGCFKNQINFNSIKLEKPKTSYPLQRRFTLIELIIVIVVIGILAGMALPKFTGVIRNSKVAAMITDIDTLEKAIMMYQQDNDTLPLLEETKTFGLQKLSESDMVDIYPSLQEALKLSEDSEEYLYKINLDESGKYHSKTKYGHGKTNKDFYVYSTKSDKVYYYDYLKDGDNNYNHNEYPIMLTSNELVEKIPSKPIESNPNNPNIPNVIQEKWKKTYSGIGNDYLYSIEQTSDGGYIACGSTEGSGDFNVSKGEKDILILKLDSKGEIEWQKTYGGFGTEYLYSIKQTSDGGYIACGSTSGGIDFPSTKGSADTLILKLNEQGNIIWKKLYGGTNHDRLYNIIETSDGGYIACGDTAGNGDFPSTNGNIDILVLKLNAQGNIIWKKLYGGTGTDYSYSIEETLDNGYILCGFTYGGGEFGIVKDERDALILKLNANGNKEWHKIYSSSGSSSLNSIKQTSDGGYITIGYTEGDGDFSSTKGGIDALILKLNSKGETEWYKMYGGSDTDAIKDIKQTKDGGYILCGQTESKDGDFISNENRDVFTLKLNSKGNIEWNKVYNNNNMDILEKIEQTEDGGYIVCGYTQSNDNFDTLILKLDENGNF